MLAILRYQHGVLHGVMESWHPNGQLAMQQAYHHGNAQGLARYWSPEGALIREEMWREGNSMANVAPFILPGSCRCVSNGTTDCVIRLVNSSIRMAHSRHGNITRAAS